MTDNYNNPVIQNGCPDPAVIDDRSRTGFFYAYSTRSRVKGIDAVLPIYRSRDMVNWEFVGDGFEGEFPKWSPGGNLWAPDINYIDGRYVLYYAMGHWGDLEKSASGVAVSDSPTGPFEDKGMIVSYANTGVLNSIDPVYFNDNGRKYLFWGSFGEGSGIFGIELSDDALSVKPGAKAVKVGTHDMEGTYIKKRKGYYYLFASRGSCCEGKRSTYHIVVARSKDILGPYEGPDGQSLLDYDYQNTILSSSGDGTFTGPGHDAGIITDDRGDDWMCYHSYWSKTRFQSRCMLMDRVCWGKDGWPYFENGQPSFSSAAPRFKNR